MAKRRPKSGEPAAPEFSSPAAAGDAYEPLQGEVIDADFPPADEPAFAEPLRHEADNGPTQGNSRGGRTGRTVMARHFDDRKIELVDDYNSGGVGIRFTYADPAERPSEEVKAILKEGDDRRPGFKFDARSRQWRKSIGRDVDPKAAVAIRLDAEDRFRRIDEQMTHEERLRRQRAHDPSTAGKSPG